MRVLHVACKREAAAPSSQVPSHHRTNLGCSVETQTADHWLGHSQDKRGFLCLFGHDKNFHRNVLNRCGTQDSTTGILGFNFHMSTNTPINGHVYVIGGFIE